MKIALIQVSQNEIYDFTNVNFQITKEKAKQLQREMIDKNLRLVEEAAKLGVDMIVTTEAINFTRTSNQCYIEVYDLFDNYDNSETLSYMSRVASQYNTYIVCSLYNWQSDNKLYNSAYVYDREGHIMDVYNKVHLAGIENKVLARGNKYLTVKTDVGKVGVCICWDMQFPEVCRELVLDGAELIVCPTWGWEAIYGHARAYENGIFVAAAMSVPYNSAIESIRNPSEVVGPDGRVIARANIYGDEVLISDIDLRECKEFKELRIKDRQPLTYKKINKI